MSNIRFQNKKKTYLTGQIFFFCLILAGLIGSVSNAANLSRICSEYAFITMEQFHQAKSKGCPDLNFPEGNVTLAHLRALCRKGTAAMAIRELMVRQNQINLCSGSLDQGHITHSRLTRVNYSALMHKWDLKHVAYKNNITPLIKEAFIPKTSEGFRLFPDGTMVWSDGCNKKIALYTIIGRFIDITPPSSTFIGCRKKFIDIKPPSSTSIAVRVPEKLEDVHYEDAIRFSLANNRLILETPTQIYTLERYPFSEMSLNPWSLHSIINRNTGESRNLGRFRTGYRHLFLEIKDDQKFSFHDLDRQIYTGVIKVGQKGQVRMHYTDESQERLRKRKKTYDYLSDSTNKYKKTKKKYATYYADELDWNSINFFKIENGELFFYSKDEIYKFEPR